MKKGKAFYISILALVAVLFSVAYFSYAFFIKTFEFNGKLNIVAGTLNYRIESDSLNSNNQITLAPGEVKIFDIDIVSLNTIDSKYALYYSTTCNNVDIKYININKLPQDDINSQEKNRITIKMINNCEVSATTTYGVQGGFKNSNLNTNGKLLVTVEGNIEARDLNYTNQEYTTCNDVQCALDELVEKFN